MRGVETRHFDKVPTKLVIKRDLKHKTRKQVSEIVRNVKLVRKFICAEKT